MGDGECPHLPVLERAHHVQPAELLAGRRVAVLTPPSRLHQLTLAIRQEVSRLGIVGQSEESHNTQNTAGDTLEDQNPAPTTHALNTVKVADTISQQAAKSSSDSGADEKVANTQGQLVLGVEEGEVDVETGEQAGLEDAEQQATGNQAAVGRGQAGHGGNDAPAQGDDGDPAARGEALEDQVGGNLEDEVGDEEDGDDNLELRGGQTKVFLEAVETGITNVDTGRLYELECMR